MNIQSKHQQIDRANYSKYYARALSIFSKIHFCFCKWLVLNFILPVHWDQILTVTFEQWIFNFNSATTVNCPRFIFFYRCRQKSSPPPSQICKICSKIPKRKNWKNQNNFCFFKKSKNLKSSPPQNPVKIGKFSKNLKSSHHKIRGKFEKISKILRQVATKSGENLKMFQKS